MTTILSHLLVFAAGIVTGVVAFERLAFWRSAATPWSEPEDGVQAPDPWPDSIVWPRTDDVEWIREKARKWRDEGRFTDAEWGAVCAVLYVEIDSPRPATDEEVSRFEERPA